MSRLLDLSEANQVCAKLKAEGKTLVATNGCFDILHIGHSRYLSQSKALADILIVGLNSDTSVRKLKGNTRPIHSQEDRAELLLALRAVDYVVIFEEDDASEFLKAVKPDIYTKGGDYSIEALPEAELAKSLGTNIVLVDKINTRSTTEILGDISNEN